jgi:FAD-linked sulfhydryl oxidase
LIPSYLWSFAYVSRWLSANLTIMPRAPPPALILISALALFVWYVFWTREHERPVAALSHADRFGFNKPHTSIPTVTPSTQVGDVVMGKLGNETLKAELGRAAWKLFHTTMARFPDEPTKDESDALKSYIHLFARLYPCGECAQHFQQILKKYPPQTGSRSSAAAWACFVHNQVNEAKGKPIFDCSNIGDWYDCGCAEDEKDEMSKAGAKSTAIAEGKHEKVEIEREGPTRGG